MWCWSHEEPQYAPPTCKPIPGWFGAIVFGLLAFLIVRCSL